MAWMIPPVCSPGSAPGEVEVFSLLRSAEGTSDWIVLHSLDLAHHQRNLQGELDFLILVPAFGILALEVKSHFSVARATDGRWHLGGDPPTTRSPFRQASDNMHSVRGELCRRLPEFGRILFCSAVCFPRASFHPPDPLEWHAWQAIDKGSLARSSIDTCIREVLVQARQHVEGKPSGSWFDIRRSLPSPSDCSKIARALRPRYEFFESPASRAAVRKEQLRKYTEEQFEALDLMESNRRVLFEGPAGTGKTLLAIESARRHSLKGGRVLLRCFNRLLGKWLASETARLEGVSSGTFHSLMLEIAAIVPPDGAAHSFWSETLPDAALDRLVSGGWQKDPFAIVILDEAQDLLRDSYLDVLDLVLEGGLSAGQWQFFGDFERQSIYSSGAADPISSLGTRRLEPARFPLWTNCRNTPRVVTLIEILSGFSSGYRHIRRPDNGIEPGWHFYANGDGQVAALEQLLRKLARNGYRDSEIVILSPLASGCAGRVRDRALAKRIGNAEAGSASGRIRMSSVHGFKGLEAPVVVVTDIEEVSSEASEALMYVAASRALERLELLAHESTRAGLLALLAGERVEGSQDG